MFKTLLYLSHSYLLKSFLDYIFGILPYFIHNVLYLYLLVLLLYYGKALLDTV